MNSNNTHITPNAALMREVLKPQPPAEPYVAIPAIKIEPGTAADAVAHKAAVLLRGLIYEHKRFGVSRDDYLAECCESAHRVEIEACQEAALAGDLVTAGAIQAVFQLTRDIGYIVPTTPAGKREMYECAIAAGRAMRGLLFKQQSLALA